MSRHRNTHVSHDEDYSAARGDYDDDYLDEDDEKRFDPYDGELYTKKQFMNEYSGTKEWDKADPEFLPDEKRISEKIDIAKDLQPKLRGENERLHNVHKVEIDIPLQKDVATTVTIKGFKDQVAKAIAAIKQLVEQWKKEQKSDLLNNVLKEWPTFETQKPLTVTYDIEKSVHQKLVDKKSEIDKRFNYGKDKIAAFAGDGSLIGDTFLLVPAVHDPSTLIEINGPSHKVEGAVVTMNGFLTHFKLMSYVKSVRRSDQVPKEKKKKKSPKPKEAPEEHEPKGVKTEEGPPARQAEPAGRGGPAGRGEPTSSEPAGRGSGVQGGRGAGADTAGRGAGVDTSAGRGTGVDQSAGRGAGVDTSAGRGAAVEPSGRGTGVIPAGRGAEGSGPEVGRGVSVESAGKGDAPGGRGVEQPAGRGAPDTGGRGTGGKGRGVGLDPNDPNAGRGRGRATPTPAPQAQGHTALEQRARKH